MFSKYSHAPPPSVLKTVSIETLVAARFAHADLME